MTMAAQLSENSHQGFDGIKAALCLGSMEAKSNTASGMPVCLWRNGIGSRSSGKERDAETGLDYFGARYYSGAQGRFITPDWSETPTPVPYAKYYDPQTLNLYAYVRNNPLSNLDKDGHVCTGDICDEVIVTATPDAPPHVIVNQKIGDQYKSGVGTTVTIQFSDKNGPLTNMPIKESNTSRSSGNQIENPNPVNTNSEGKIKDVVMKAVASESDPNDSPSSTEVRDYVNSHPLPLSSTQTLLFSPAGGQTCEAIIERTLSNTDANGTINSKTNSQGVNFNLSITKPVVRKRKEDQ